MSNEYAGMVQRLWQRDISLWAGASSSEPVARRLGWLDAVSFMEKNNPELTTWAHQLAGKNQFDTLLLLGMGGSSLAPQVIASIFGSRPGFPRLLMLDTTSPGQIQAADVDPEKTLVIVSSKSGTTIETADLFAYFHELFAQKLQHPGDHFIAITDAGSWLSNQASELGFLRTFINPTDIGGRYSALSFFGLVPAALMGVDLAGILHRCRTFAEITRSPQGEAQVLDLAVLIGHGAASGCNKLILDIDSPIQMLSIWIEQLVAESTGKNGVGVLPVANLAVNAGAVGKDVIVAHIRFGQQPVRQGETPVLPEAAAVNLHMQDALDLGSEFLRWEMATSIAASMMNINPFDQPDVELAKLKTRHFIEAGITLNGETVLDQDHFSIIFPPTPGLPGSLVKTGPLENFALAASDADYLAILAYLPVTEEITNHLEQLRRKLSTRLGKLATCGFGPRYLHSTGQFHKGGPPSGCFLQIVEADPGALPIPGRHYSFDELHRAQADGDFTVLAEKKLPIMRIRLKGDRLGALENLASELT